MYKLLDRLESVIMDGVPIPFLPFSLVNQEKLIVLLDKIQTAIPDEIQKADQILTQKDEIYVESQRRAQQMLQEAKQQAESMLSDSELMKAVHLEADRVRQQVMAELQTVRQQMLEDTEAFCQKSVEEAKWIRQSADEYADTVLKTLSKNLEEFQGIAKNAQKQLKRTRAEAMQHHSGPANLTSGAYGPKAKDVSRPIVKPTERTPEKLNV